MEVVAVLRLVCSCGSVAGLRGRWRVTLSAARREVVLERPGARPARARVDPRAGVSLALSGASPVVSAPGQRIELQAAPGLSVTATRGSEAVLVVEALEDVGR
jgi:hypothetical protein